VADERLLDELRWTHDALDRLLALVWREQPDLDAVRRAADVLRLNHARRELPITASFVLPDGPAQRLCLDPDPSGERTCCVLYVGHEGSHADPARGLYW
jgi:hypothetical protein